MSPRISRSQVERLQRQQREIFGNNFTPAQVKGPFSEGPDELLQLQKSNGERQDYPSQAEPIDLHHRIKGPGALKQNRDPGLDEFGFQKIRRLDDDIKSERSRRQSSVSPLQQAVELNPRVSPRTDEPSLDAFATKAVPEPPQKEPRKLPKSKKQQLQEEYGIIKDDFFYGRILGPLDRSRASLRQGAILKEIEEIDLAAASQAKNSSDLSKLQSLESSVPEPAAARSPAELMPSVSAIDRPEGADDLFDREAEAFGAGRARKLLKKRQQKAQVQQAAQFKEAKVQEVRNAQLADDALKPWAEYERSGESYKGRSSDEWLNQQDEMMGYMMNQLESQGITRPDFNDPDVRQLIDEVQSMSPDLSPGQVMTNLNIARRGLNSGRVLPTKEVQFNVAGAAADEKLGLGALGMSDYTDLELLNQLDPFATDLRARFAGDRLMIDSQKMMGNRTVGIGALMNVENIDELDAFLRSDPNRSVLESLQQLQAASKRAGTISSENKLMQTLDDRYNPNASDDFLGSAGLKAKDALLLSDRRSYVADNEAFRSGSYDSTKADGLYMLDLNTLREQLGSIGYEQLLRQGGDLRSKRVPRQRQKLEQAANQRGNNLYDVSLALPINQAMNMQGSLGGISPEALARFVQ